ncbi:hypothetical protein FVE85_3926 [Porphyridium purpureum]|uniref:Uncharacterized protein n=1 Tax=Porphyridium purpureum TaxID=35688 RepID=A0A5J4YR50_PORPP|nr:hypothetical protein FVE85_3926 [Porphyridium purpureum]|eukprot:POR5036..scf229_5
MEQSNYKMSREFWAQTEDDWGPVRSRSESSEDSISSAVQNEIKFGVLSIAVQGTARRLPRFQPSLEPIPEQDEDEQDDGDWMDASASCADEVRPSEWHEPRSSLLHPVGLRSLTVKSGLSACLYHVADAITSCREKSSRCTSHQLVRCCQ